MGIVAKNIRFYKIDSRHLQELESISKETYADAFADANTAENLQAYLDTAFATQQLDAEIKNKNAAFYFAKIDNETVGYLKVNFKDAQTDIQEDYGMELQRIYVRRKYQGQKIGKKLLEHTFMIAKKNNMAYIWLGVWEKNKKAIDFYIKNGFEICGNHPFKMGTETQNDYIMKYAMTPFIT